MKKVEIPPEKDIVQIYIIKNLNKESSAKFFNVSVATFKKWLHLYSIKKPLSLIRESIKKTCLDKYGVEFSSQSKLSREKFKQTCIQKYGTTSYLKTKEFREKSKETNLKKRGVEFPTQSQEVLTKRIKNNIKKYGVDYPQQLDKVKNKTRETCIARYGVSTTLLEKKTQEKIKLTNLKLYGVKNPFESGIIRDKIKKVLIDKYGSIYPMQNTKISDKVRRTNLKNYGTKTFAESSIPLEIRNTLNNKEKLKNTINALYSKTFVSISEALNVADTTVAFYVRKHNLEYLIDQHTSRPEQEIKTLLSEIKLRKDRTVLDGQEIDLYSEEYKIGIEFNGNYWHTDKCLNKSYHYNKSKLAEEKGVFLFHIFEYEWQNPRVKQVIISRLKNIFNLNKNKIYARNCIIKEVNHEEAKIFLNQNHTQGSAPSNIRLGLYHNNELVALMEFITNGINKNYQYELSRFCSKLGYNVVGGANKLFKYFLKTYSPKSVISYSDIAKTTGKLYETLGFKMNHISNPQYHWTNGHTTLSRYQTQLKQLRKRGWLKEGETKSESQVMREHGFNKIYDCGKKVWVWLSL